MPYSEVTAQQACSTEMVNIDVAKLDHDKVVIHIDVDKAYIIVTKVSIVFGIHFCVDYIITTL